MAIDQLSVITERIVKRFHPLTIILFGSQARGDSHQWSDVDLLVVVPKVEDKWEKKQEIERALREFRLSADVIVATPDEIRARGDMVGTVLRPALREGKLLYRAEGNGHVPNAEPVSEEDAAKEAAVWLIVVDDDIALAEDVIGRPDRPPRHAGFNAQQAAEKALKAVYIFLQIQYPFSHDLDELRNGLPSDWPLTDVFPDLEELSKWAVVQRYPGAQGAWTRDDARRHVHQARALLDVVKRELRAHGFTVDL